MTKLTKPKKNWIQELKLFDKQQAKSNADYYSHTIHINTNDLNYLNNTNKRKDTINHD